MGRPSNTTTVRGREVPGDAGGRTLLLVTGVDHFALHEVPADGELTFGRDPSCGVVLGHDKISRRHARVRAGALAHAVGGALILEDLGSTNGVVVGGVPLGAGQTVALNTGDSFQLGPYTVLAVSAADPGAGRDARAEVTVLDPTPRGASPVVARLAASAVSVLILGETGTGKEVLARTLHELSGRPGPFVGINCAALSESLLESELFGHERGAFTGAVQAKPGLLETAPRGTVFLDEIGDLPTGLQAKLLRALETREVQRVGGLKPIPLDVRFLAATHRDLGLDVAAGRFRRDLYYRVNGVTLRLPPLRDRRAAIPDLARGFLAAAAEAAGRPVPRLGLEAIGRLSRHDWPGNVRELRAVMERALLLGGADEVDASAILIDTPPPTLPPDDEDARFLAVARRHHGNVTAIARELATSRSQVRRLAQRLGVNLGRLRDET
jgi:transcriptional regulator of acetoin/glycerol metabolism